MVSPSAPGHAPSEATTSAWFAPVPSLRSSAKAALTEPEPIFAALLQLWQEAGRYAPGGTDEEWTILTRRYPWL